MKVRSDYVSNSSSSSFILGNHPIFDFFKVTKQDIMNALIDSYGQEDYDRVHSNCKKNQEEHPDWNTDEIETGVCGPFYVYDLSDEKDRANALKCWGDMLKEFETTNCHFDESGSVEYGGYQSEYDSIIRNICEVYGTYESDIKDTDEPKVFVPSNVQDPKTKMYGHYEPLDKEVVDFLKNLKKTCGIINNLDALKCDLARFFVHADDNELFHRSSTHEESEKYSSEYYTYDRICEIVFNYLVKIGKINPQDEKFLSEMRIDDQYLSKYEKENGLLWNFYNGKTPTWKDLKFNSLTWCMHEG